MSERVATLDGDLARRGEAQLAHADAIGERGERLSARIAEIEAHLARIAERSGEAAQTLAAGSEHFAAVVGSNAQQLSETEAAVARLRGVAARREAAESSRGSPLINRRSRY